MPIGVNAKSLRRMRSTGGMFSTVGTAPAACISSTKCGQKRHGAARAAAARHSSVRRPRSGLGEMTWMLTARAPMRSARSARRSSTSRSAALSRVTSKSPPSSESTGPSISQREVRRHVCGACSRSTIVVQRRWRRPGRPRPGTAPGRPARRRRPAAGDRRAGRASAAPSGSSFAAAIRRTVRSPRASATHAVIAELGSRALDVGDQVAPRRLARCVLRSSSVDAGQLDDRLGQLAEVVPMPVATL